MVMNSHLFAGTVLNMTSEQRCQSCEAEPDERVCKSHGMQDYQIMFTVTGVVVIGTIVTLYTPLPDETFIGEKFKGFRRDPNSVYSILH